MNIPPLCIIQARYNSTRLPGKMLLKLGDETLIERALRIACEAFGSAHAVVAIPARDADGPLGDELRRLCAQYFAWDGAEYDVLSRFYHCAHGYRWHPQSVIVRHTPDDHRKNPAALARVANGWREPVELGGEAFTLKQLTRAHQRTHPDDREAREHLSHNPDLFAAMPMRCGAPGVWTIDTQEDYDAAVAQLDSGNESQRRLIDLNAIAGGQFLRDDQP